MKRKIVAAIFILFLVLLLALGATGLCHERSPFEDPPKGFLYNYEKALSTLSLKGLITTGRFNRAIFLIHGIESALSKGDTFSINVEDLKYTFTLKDIEKKKVVLQGADGKIYGVSP